MSFRIRHFQSILPFSLSALKTVVRSEEQTSIRIETPNVMVEWLALLPHVREVPGSDLGPETGYPE
jgi:hypothetical protein